MPSAPAPAGSTIVAEGSATPTSTLATTTFQQLKPPSLRPVLLDSEPYPVLPYAHKHTYEQQGKGQAQEQAFGTNSAAKHGAPTAAVGCINTKRHLVEKARRDDAMYLLVPTV